MSAALLGKETATKSTPISAAVLMSSMSLAVSAGAVRPPPWRLMPLLLERIAADQDAGVDFVAAHAEHFQLEPAIVEQQDVAEADVLGQVLVVEADALLVAQRAGGSRG